MMHACVTRDHGAVADIAVLIPVLQPDARLAALVSKLLDFGFGAIIIVDDGCDAKGQGVFKDLSRQSRVYVLRHPANLGKGRALKTGLAFFHRRFPEFSGIVTADADGQHRAEDIFSTAEQIQSHPGRIVLGSRRLGKDAPIRSRLGNAITRQVFGLLTGKRLADTQCGLRGIAASLVPSLLAVDGEGYDYEMNVLTHAATSSRVFEVPVEDVYLDGNRSAHFRPIAGSAKIYLVLLRFCASSLIAGAIDFLVFAGLFALTSNLLASVIAGRLSSLFNFALNRRYVFNSNIATTRALARYYALATLLAVASYFATRYVAETFGMNVLAAKLFVETLLWFASFSIQRTFIFAPSLNPTQ